MREVLRTVTKREHIMTGVRTGTFLLAVIAPAAYGRYAQDRVGYIDNTANIAASTQVIDPPAPLLSEDIAGYTLQIGSLYRKEDDIKEELASTNFFQNEDNTILNRAFQEAEKQKIDGIEAQIDSIQSSDGYQAAIAPQREYEKTLSDNAQLRDQIEDEVKADMNRAGWSFKSNLSATLSVVIMFGSIPAIGMESMLHSAKRASWPLPERKRKVV